MATKPCATDETYFVPNWRSQSVRKDKDWEFKGTEEGEGDCALRRDASGGEQSDITER